MAPIAPKNVILCLALIIKGAIIIETISAITYPIQFGYSNPNIIKNTNGIMRIYKLVRKTRSNCVFSPLNSLIPNCKANVSTMIISIGTRIPSKLTFKHLQALET